jgi:hypothetical protein
MFSTARVCSCKMRHCVDYSGFMQRGMEDGDGEPRSQDDTSCKARQNTVPPQNFHFHYSVPPQNASTSAPPAVDVDVGEKCAPRRCCVPENKSCGRPRVSWLSSL